MHSQKYILLVISQKIYTVGYFSKNIICWIFLKKYILLDIFQEIYSVEHFSGNIFCWIFFKKYIRLEIYQWIYLVGYFSRNISRWIFLKKYIQMKCIWQDIYIQEIYSGGYFFSLLRYFLKIFQKNFSYKYESHQSGCWMCGKIISKLVWENILNPSFMFWQG